MTTKQVVARLHTRVAQAEAVESMLENSYQLAKKVGVTDEIENAFLRVKTLLAQHRYQLKERAYDALEG